MKTLIEVLSKMKAQNKDSIIAIYKNGASTHGNAQQLFDSVSTEKNLFSSTDLVENIKTSYYSTTINLKEA